MSRDVVLNNDDVIWIQMNQEFLWENFPGRWIAVHDQELVAVGDSAHEVLEEAHARGFTDPLISGVRKREYQNLKMIRLACRA